MTEECSVLLKMMMVGDSGVGKTSLLSRYSDTSFADSYISTIGVDFKLKYVDIDDTTVRMQIWDTAGQERFKSLTASYYRGAHGIIIVYDITDYESFRNVKKWLFEVDKYASANVIKHLVGNKSDISGKRQVPYDEAAEFASSLGMDFIETSAKDSTNVDDAFLDMARKIMKKVMIKPMVHSKSSDPRSIRLSGQRVSSDSVCC